jgi:hypothetical protein
VNKLVDDSSFHPLFCLLLPRILFLHLVAIYSILNGILCSAHDSLLHVTITNNASGSLKKPRSLQLSRDSVGSGEV